MADSTTSDKFPSSDLNVECSDDEKYEIKDKWIKISGMEIPPADDIASLHEVLCVDRVISLEWMCLGRRPPTPEGSTASVPESSNRSESKNDDFFDFDMDDLPSSQPKLPVRRREGELKGGARKKTASFDGVINNMKRFWKLDNESPQNPSSQ